jgi:predicted PurR-regulated permease PerM
MRPVWLDRHLWQIQPVRDILAIMAVVGLFWLGSKLSIVTVPLLLAILFAYLLEPVIQWLMRRASMQRRGAVSAILAALVLAVLVPSALGLTFGVIQGAGFVRSMADNVDLLQRSVNAELAVRRLESDREISDRAAARGASEEQADESGAAAATPAGADPEGPQAEPEANPQVVADLEAGPGVDPESGEEAAQPAVERADEEPAAIEPPTREQIAAARAARDILRNRLEHEAGKSWVKMRDFIVGDGERGSLVGFVETLADWLRAEPGRVAQAAAGVSVSAAQALLAFFIGAFALAFGTFLTAFFFYFVATEWVKVQHFATNLVPERNKERTLELAVKFDRAINAFIRGRLTIAFIQAIIFSVGYFVIGVPAAFILGPAVALLSIVPYLALVGVPISITLLWLENHTGLRGHILWVLAAPAVIYFIGQALDDYVLTPAIQGKSTDMSTPAILFASLAGGALFGVFGLLIAIPIAACLKIVIQEILWPRFRAWAEGRSKDFLPISD